MTRAEAEALGWSFEVAGEDGVASKDGRAVVSVTSSTPVFALLLHVSQLEGQPFAEGFGGDAEITPVLVSQASGETYTPDATAPREPPPPPAANAVLGALEMLDPATATVADVVNAVKAALTSSGAQPAAG